MASPRERSFEARVVARGRRIVLAAPCEQDEEELLSLRRASWDFLAPWELDITGVDPLGPSWFARYLRVGPQHRRERWLVRMRRSGRICGSITIGEIEPGARRATLGYWIGAKYARRGLMSEALTLAVARALGELALRELHAYVLPENVASRGLLAKLGFTRNGVARGYRRIRGEERDHERWTISGPNREGSGSPD
jgi:ribosomal-protein-alanine N-acetyltransferase